MRPLYKTTVVIWSEYDASDVELEDLARDATSGESYCSYSRTELISRPEKNPHWDDTEFFSDGEIIERDVKEAQTRGL